MQTLAPYTETLEKILTLRLKQTLSSHVSQNVIGAMKRIIFDLHVSDIVPGA